MELINQSLVTDEQIAEAIEEYFKENPTDDLPVATDEEVEAAINSIFGNKSVQR
jgi:t-SNARE complex subunit (syntaxin)